MSKNKEETVNEVNLKEDSNDNGVPDWIEAVTTYLIASICVILAVHGYAKDNLDPTSIRWLMSFAAALSGGRDLIKGFIGGR
ncbi:MAG: hypothetical protein ACOC4G_14850 [Bacillota bacterium]